MCAFPTPNTDTNTDTDEFVAHYSYYTRHYYNVTDIISAVVM